MIKRRRKAKQALEKQNQEDGSADAKKAKRRSYDEVDQATKEIQSENLVSVAATDEQNLDRNVVVEPTDTRTEEEKRLERQRLKNQQRKALRKSKKESKAKAEAEIQCARAKEQEALKAEKEAKKEEKRKLEQLQTGDFETLEMGVQYHDVIVGSGSIVENRKKVRVKYTLRARHRLGKKIDSKSKFEFRVGKGDVIKGWDIGLMGMRQGGVRQIIVPPEAGYQNRNIGAGPGGLLFFEVTLLCCGD